MKNARKQQGASTPVVILFVSMAMIVLTIAFKLYPAFYENWQLRQVLESFNDDLGIEDLSVKEIRARFDKRLLTNNVRDFNSDESITLVRDDDSFSIYVEYEVRVPIYDNIDAIVSFEESLEKQL
tara:strand:- start:26406 stop:26780 length:375 start_codon:yes stop_codon:yes gene_type:complete